MVNFVILIFIGGALGAMLREFIMLMMPHLANDFPLAILVANLVAAFLLGLFTALHDRRIVSSSVYMLLGTGVMGGLSTFSSLAYGALVLMSASMAGAVVAFAYIVTSLVLGYIAVTLGLRVGGQHRAETAPEATGNA